MRVMVVNQSEQLRQVLQYVFENGIEVDVVAETSDIAGLPEQIRRLQPEWLFLLQEEYGRLTGVINQLLAAQQNLHIILLSTDGQHVRFQQDQHWHKEIAAWPEYSLSDFIYYLKEVDPSPAAAKSIEDIGAAAPPKFVRQASGR